MLMVTLADNKTQLVQVLGCIMLPAPSTLSLGSDNLAQVSNCSLLKGIHGLQWKQHNDNFMWKEDITFFPCALHLFLTM